MSESKPKDNSEQRTLVALALCMAVFFVWSEFFAPKPDPAVDAAAADGASVTAAAGTEAGAVPAQPAVVAVAASPPSVRLRTP